MSTTTQHPLMRHDKRTLIRMIEQAEQNRSIHALELFRLREWQSKCREKPRLGAIVEENERLQREYDELHDELIELREECNKYEAKANSLDGLDNFLAAVIAFCDSNYASLKRGDLGRVGQDLHEQFFRCQNSLRSQI